MRDRREHRIILLVLVIFYMVGLIGLSMSEYRSNIVSLTPMNLLLTAGLFIWGQPKVNTNFFLIAIAVFLLGFGIEVAGVKTGVLFGVYEYGAPLGWKVLDVPLMIGVNWFLLSFSSIGVAHRFSKSPAIKVTLASLVMVALDFLIEPVAIALNFWQWANHDVPVQNYVMWFIAAAVINSVIQWKVNQIDFRVSLYVLLAQAIFFGILNLTLAG